jgi:hypothetical protein
MPELVGPGDLEIAWPAPAALAADGLQQRVLAHQPLAAFAIDRPSSAPGGDRGDHPRAVGGVLVLARDGQHDAVQLVQRAALSARRAPRTAVDRLAADARHAGYDRDGAALRDESAGSATRTLNSQPRKSSPAISTSIVLRPNARSSLAT